MLVTVPLWRPLEGSVAAVNTYLLASLFSLLALPRPGLTTIVLFGDDGYNPEGPLVTFFLCLTLLHLAGQVHGGTLPAAV